MKFKEKIFLLHGFIHDTIDKMIEGKTKRIQKNKSIPSGLFAFEIDGKDEIRTFGDLERLHDVFVHCCKIDLKFQRFLSSVIAESHVHSTPTVDEFIEEIKKMQTEK